MQLHISKTIEALNHVVADWLVQYIHDVLQKQDRFTIALTGGNTPKSLYQLLASDAYRNKIDWSKLHFFWGDGRFVDFDDDRNNAKIAFDTLLNFVPVVKEQIHIIQTENISPKESADEYEKLLHEYFDGKDFSFDLVFLGMGDDAHTLSLFPNTALIDETKKWTGSFWLDAQNMYRVTLTAPIVNQSARVAFVATGANKQNALKEVLYGEKNNHQYPSQIIQPKGQLHWFVDEAAAGLLK